jgi:RNA recognition motif-containing protein
MSANAESVVAAVENTAQKAQTTAPNTVEAVTEAIKNTSISPKNDFKNDSADVDAAHAASAAEGRRLYIGNLAYSTTDEQLREFFTGFSM